jgi:hypothetical protein
MPSIHLEGNINITFIHIPKTAGTSIGHWMQANSTPTKSDCWYEHPSLENIKAQYKVVESFTVVRNPWDRMVSFYHYFKNPYCPNPKFTSEQLQMYVNNLNKIEIFPTFENWLLNAQSFKLPPWWWWNAITPQSQWISDETTILRYENLKEDFKQIQRKFNTDKELPVENVSDHTHYSTYYNDQTKQIIYQWFREDIERWQYKFA